MNVVAHLNGGPMDDQKVQVTSDRFGVPRHVNLRSMLAGPEAPDPTRVTTQTGSYRMRRDTNGQPVPHDLSGVIEFDWQGWG
jgi:hypothetical protein